MSALTGIRHITVDPVTAQVAWRVLHKHVDQLTIDMIALEERLKGGADGPNKEAWHVLDTEKMIITDFLRQLQAEPPPPTVGT